MMGLDIILYEIVWVKESEISNLEWTEYIEMEKHPGLINFADMSFLKEIEEYDLNKAALGKGYNKLEDLEWLDTDFGEEVGEATYYFRDSDGKSIEFINPPLSKKKVKCLRTKKVGYQRRGANDKFYEDDMWDSPCVTDKATLLEHWKKYFSNYPSEPVSEIEQSYYKKYSPDMKKRFKDNIIDKFVEGKHIVCYG